MDESDWRSLAKRYGPHVILVAIALYMVWIRTLGFDHVVKPDAVYFTAGNDPWYHARMVQYAVEHFPKTIRFDPYSHFPWGTGRHSGFGGLFDQTIALGALLIGLGSPSERLVNISTAFAPAIYGSLTIFPLYVVAKRFTDRWGALLPAAGLALVGGGYLQRTVIGSADHQSAEAFYATLAIAGFLYAVWTAYEEKPTTADIRDRTWFVLRRPLIGGVLGGVAMAAYLMMWGPGVMIIFTLGVFVVLQSIRDHFRGTSPEYLAFATATSMGTAAILTLMYAKSYALEATAFSLLQPLVFAGIATGSIGIAFLSRYVRRSDYDAYYYPVMIFSLGVLLLGFSAVLAPRVIGLFETLIVRVYSFGYFKSQTGLTVAELQTGTINGAWGSYGGLLYVAVAGALLLVYRVLQRDRPTELLVLLWSFTMTSAYFTAVRFGYYLAVNVALLSGYAIWYASRYTLDLGAIRAASDVEAYQVMGVLAILILVVPGNVVAMGGNTTNWKVAGPLAVADTDWQQELDWMSENTPEEELEYLGDHERPPNGDFAYGDGTYGVMSWWDYGHWITYTAKRIPVANPFQQGPRVASAYLQAKSEEMANLILEALPAMDAASDIRSLSKDGTRIASMEDELRSIANSRTAQERKENTRYVVIDDQMAALDGRRSGLRRPKFGAITTWIGPGAGSYISTEEVTLRRLGSRGFQRTNQTARLPAVNDRFRQTMLSKLYFRDANGLEHYRLVHETNQTAIFLNLAQQTQNGYQRVTSLLNGLLTRQALQLLQQRSDIYAYDVRQESRVKTFERVPGARLEGTVPEAANVTNGTSVIARLPIRTNTGRNLTYTQRTTVDEDGTFNLTVPYATNDAVQPSEGGTDSGVTATGNYTIQVGGTILRFQGQAIPYRAKATGTVRVPESAIYGGETIEVSVVPIQRNTSSNASATASAPVDLSSGAAKAPGSVTSVSAPSGDLPVARARGD